MDQPPEFGSSQNYKIKLASGRILGPLDLERVKLLILKNQITGVESAREYPQGDWKDINQIGEIAELIIAHAAGNLKKPDGHRVYDPAKGKNAALVATTIFKNNSPALPGATEIFNSNELAALPETLEENGEVALKEEGQDERTIVGNGVATGATVNDEDEKTVMSQALAPHAEENDKTRVSMTAVARAPGEGQASDGSVVLDAGPDPAAVGVVGVNVPTKKEEPAQAGRELGKEQTVMFQRSSGSSKLLGRIKWTRKQIVQGMAFVLIFGSIAYDAFFSGPEKPQVINTSPIRPKLPEYVEGKSDPKKSMQIYNDASRD